MDADSEQHFSHGVMQYAVRPLAVAGFFVLVAFLWTLLLQHLVAYPFLFLFLGAVMGSAWFGGRISGLIAVILSTAMIDYFFVPPFYSFYVNNVAQTYCAAFIVCAVTMSWVSSTRKRSETAIRDARDQLERRVMERTAELQRSNEEIQESERRLRTLTEAIPQQIWSAGADGEIDYCNNHLLEYTGHAPDELNGEEFFRILHPEDEPTFRESWAASRESAEKLEGEWRVKGGDGEYRWFLVRSVPQRSGAGREVGRWYGTHIDIEERRRAERALVEAQTELSDLSHRLSMGELAASIAHELGQPLTAVMTNAYACREWLQASPANFERASSTAEKIVVESKRASEVVARVRALFRKEIDSRSFVDLNRLIRDLVRLLHDDAVRRRISVQVELDPNLPRVTVDPVQIQQVLLNLATNGMDAMAQTKRRELLIRSQRNGGKEIQIEVKDRGVGIDPAIAERIFDPFFTTKEQGIGMGLAISRTIVEAHDGRLWASPDASGGSSFQFTLPVRS